MNNMWFCVPKVKKKIFSTLGACSMELPTINKIFHSKISINLDTFAGSFNEALKPQGTMLVSVELMEQGEKATRQGHRKRLDKGRNKPNQAMKAMKDGEKSVK